MKKAYLYAAGAIFFWSTAATVSKILLRELNNIQLLWMNSLWAGVFLLVLNIALGNFKKHKDYTVKDYLVMAAISIPATVLYYVFYYAGTDILPASQAFIINYLWPIMSLIFACVILKEKLTAKKIFAILISFFGVTIVVGGDLGNFDRQMLFGALYCILGAISYGLYTALSKKMPYDKMMTLMVGYFVAFVFTTVLNFVRGELFVPAADQILGFAWSGIFTAATANTCWALAIANGKTEKISNLAYITPFLSIVWTAIFLREEIGLNSLLGLAVIVLGIVMQLRKTGKTKTAGMTEADG